MALTTTDTLALIDNRGAASSPLYKAPKIQVIAQLHGDSTQIVTTVAFADDTNMIQAAKNLSFSIADLEADYPGFEAAYNTIMNALDQAAKVELEAIEDNDRKTITYTARTK